jgi:hypothetical protein
MGRLANNRKNTGPGNWTAPNRLSVEKYNEFTMAMKFPVRTNMRDRKRLRTMNINAESDDRIMGGSTPTARGTQIRDARDPSRKTKPGAVSRPGTPTQFQFDE